MTEPATTLSTIVNTPGFRIKRSPIFNHIPVLRELLPKTGGLPSLAYAQITVENMLEIQEAGWDEVADAVMYVIKGPSGIASCKLHVYGTPNPGLSIGITKQKCMIDKSIREKTGILSGRFHDTSDSNADISTNLPVEEEAVLVENQTTVEAIEPTPEREISTTVSRRVKKASTDK